MKLQAYFRLFITALFLVISSFTYSANRYWVWNAIGSQSWSNSTYWSATSGGAGGASVPGSADIAIFDGNLGTNGNCSIDMAVNIAGFTVTSGYSGTISQGANTITVGTSNASFSGGTFTGGSSAITINGTFTLSGTTFTSTSNTLAFASTVTNTSGTFTHNSGTVSFNSTGTQIIPAWNFYNLTSTSTGTRTLASAGVIGIINTFTKGGNTYSTITGSTVEYKGTGAQTIASIGYNNLTISGARGGAAITLANSGTIGILGTFSITATSFTVVNTSSTVSYNGTGAQTVLTLNYNSLTITGAHATNNITLANTGLNSNVISISGIFTNSATFTSGAYVNTGSTIEYNSTGAQTIIAFNYNSLTISGARTTSSVTLASTGVIRIAGTFNNSATFTSGSIIPTGSTVEYNGTGAQTVIALNYNNLTITGAHTSNNVTLASSGTIGVSKTFLPLATFTSGVYVSTSSTVDYKGTLPQVIAAFPYNHLTSSSSGARAFASTGSVGIAGVFTKGSNTYTNIGSTGEGYAPQTNLNNTHLVGASAVSTSTAFVSGIGGIIYKTTDGGTTWVSQTSNTTNDLYALKFHNSNTGLAVGNNGTIDRTTNGGATWGTVTSGTAVNLRSVAFSSSTVAFAGGLSGVIRKSIDGGATWGSTTTGTSEAIYAISFLDINTGYACGWNGTILKTTNGGSNWSTLTSGVTDQLTSIKFLDATTGIVVGANGRILKTTNAGVTWVNIASGTTDQFSALAFYDKNNGYIFGGNIANNTSTLLKTTDGGNTWTIHTIGYNRLTAMEMFDKTTGYIAGLDGHIVKYTCCTSGSTTDFNGTGAQTVPAFNYHNLTLSGARTTNSITLANSGTIGVSGSITNIATFTSGSIVTTSNTVDLNGVMTQTIPAFTFNNLTTNNTGKKSVTGNITVNGTLNLVKAELALAGNTLTMASNAANVVTQTVGYISTTGVGKLSRPTASMSSYLFPMGYKTINDSADYFTFSLVPGKTSAQNFQGSVNSTSTGFVITHDKALHGAVSSMVLVTISTGSYNSIPLQYDINTSADISAVRIMDANDNNTMKTLDPALYTITGGNQLNILNVYQLYLIYSKIKVNSNLNWTYEVSYDGNGLPLSEQIQYMDMLGRPTQTQVRNVADNTVIATQSAYDNYGRAALQTLPAPIGSVMAYQNNFITNPYGVGYTYTDFDKPATASTLHGEINNPYTVNNSSPGTLGWYYSDNNTLEAYQATTSYPYSRSELTGAGRNAAAGDEYRMGAGHESKGYSMVSGNELKFIFGTDKSYKSATTADRMVNNALTITGGIQAGKNISIDADGKEMVSYDVGGVSIAICYTGIAGACTMTTVTNTMIYAGTSSTDIHLPYANKTTSPSMKLPLPQYGINTVSSSDIAYKITDVATNTVLELGTDYSVNAVTRLVTFLGTYTAGSSVFRISFIYTQSLLNYFAANAITIPDATVTYDLDYSRWSVNYYDLAGRLRKSVSAKGINCSSAGTITMATTYDYSSMGQVVASLSADEGLKEMTYDAEGKPRFSQDAVQRSLQRFSYINYDAHGRANESGEYYTTNAVGSIFFQKYYGGYPSPWGLGVNTPTSSIINHIGNTGMLPGDCNDKNNIYYYPLASGEELSVTGYTAGTYVAKYTMGKVCKTKNANSATWYGYNQAGQTVFTVQQMLDADYIGYQSGINNQVKTVDYTYNAANGTLSDQTYQKNGTTEKLKHLFTYDAAMRLTQVDVSIAGAAAVLQAKYSYYKTGALKRKELGDKLQGIDYIYTVNGQLKSINNPSLDETKDPGQDGNGGVFGKDLFGLTLDYHTGDYIRTGSNVLTSTSSIYNSMISAQRFKTRAVTNSIPNGADYLDYPSNTQQIITSPADEIMTKYTYDEEYRLNKAELGKYASNTFTINANNCFKEWGASSNSGIGYDANGNITSLKRNGSTNPGYAMDDFSYTYTSNTNKLASIIDAVADNAYSDDFNAAASQSFTYNVNGQMTASTAEKVTAITYYSTGLTKKVSYSAPANSYAEYWYDDRGQKIKTKYYNGASAKFIWYVNDAGGNPLAIYEYDQATPGFTLAQEVLYGNGRIGTLNKVTGVIDYEITDHLGNVRAAFKFVSGSLLIPRVIELTSRADYYAFGGAMPGRSSPNVYRYKYQGQENAVESKWQMFELRMHNSDLGRWFAPDPAGQFHSPYISMGNNPVSGVDPDGGRVNGYLEEEESGPKTYRIYNQRTGAVRYVTGSLNLGLDEIDVTDAYEEGQRRKLFERFSIEPVAPIQHTSNFYWGENGYGDEDDFGWEFDAASWARDLLWARVDATRAGLNKEEVRNATNQASKHGYNAALAYITETKKENDKKMLKEMIKAYRLAIAEANKPGSDITTGPGGNGFPTASAGGFINDFSTFKSFMLNQAVNNPVEVAALALANGRYFIQPWAGNDATTSKNDLTGTNLGFTRQDVIGQYHTHPDDLGPSRNDAMNSAVWGGLPVHTVGPSGALWQVVTPFGYEVRKNVPGIFIPYGSIIGYWR